MITNIAITATEVTLTMADGSTQVFTMAAAPTSPTFTQTLTAGQTIEITAQ